MASTAMAASYQDPPPVGTTLAGRSLWVKLTTTSNVVESPAKVVVEEMRGTMGCGEGEGEGEGEDEDEVEGEGVSDADMVGVGVWVLEWLGEGLALAVGSTQYTSPAGNTREVFAQSMPWEALGDPERRASWSWETLKPQ